MHLIAEFVETLRAFGCTDDDSIIERGLKALLACQEESGIWDVSDDPYRTYHATMCGAQALLAHKYRGFGPGIPAVLPLLREWAAKDLEKIGRSFYIDQLDATSATQTEWTFRDVFHSLGTVNATGAGYLSAETESGETMLSGLKDAMKDTLQIVRTKAAATKLTVPMPAKKSSTAASAAPRALSGKTKKSESKKKRLLHHRSNHC